MICEYHFFWQENFTDCDRSFQKILKCPSVFSEIYNKMAIFYIFLHLFNKGFSDGEANPIPSAFGEMVIMLQRS